MHRAYWSFESKRQHIAGLTWLTSTRPAMKTYTYAEVTTIAFDQITEYMRAARRCTGAEARSKKEVAYGVYIGWRALVESYSDQESYRRDDRRLELLLID